MRHISKESPTGTKLVTAGLAFPTIIMVIIGIALLQPAYVIYFIIAFLVEGFATFGLIGLGIGRRLLSHRPPLTRPTGDAHPFWIRMNVFYTLFGLLDATIAILFAYASRYSSLPPQAALLLMGLFFPFSYLISFLFRDAYLDSIDAYFRYPINRPSTLLWFYSSLARVFVGLRVDRGINYLEKSLIAARELCEDAGQSSVDVEHALGLLRLLSDAGIPPNYDALQAYVTTVFGLVPRLDRLPLESRNLLDAHPWFADFTPVRGEGVRKERNLFGILSQAGKIISALGVGSIIIALYQHAPKALSGAASGMLTWLGSEEATLVVVITVIFVSYLPAIHLWSQFKIFVRLSDVLVYEENLRHGA